MTHKKVTVMPHERVFTLPSGSPAAQRALADVLAWLGCVDIVDDIANAEVVIVLMGGALPAEEHLRSALAPAADGAFALIGIHAPDGDGDVPEILEDWTTGGFYPLDEAVLRDVLCEGNEGWLDASGGVRPEPTTRRECSKRNC